LTLDTDWYLATQIPPAVARLCELADRFELFAASWEDCSNLLKETGTEVYECLYGSVVDPAQLFRGLLY
jgi:hypothetical protein